MLEAFEAKLIRQGDAGVENIVSTLFKGVDLWLTPRITNDDWYLAIADYPEKPIFALERNDLGGMQQILVTEDNSDECRDKDIRKLLFRMRKGYGVSQRMNIVKINN